MAGLILWNSRSIPPPLALTPSSIGLNYGKFRGELRRELRVRAYPRKPFEPDPGHAGEGTGHQFPPIACPAPVMEASRFPRSNAMNKPLAAADLATPKVTTG